MSWEVTEWQQPTTRPCSSLIEQGILQPQRLVERTIGLEEAAALLPRFDHATVAGMTIVDPAR